MQIFMIHGPKANVYYPRFCIELLSVFEAGGDIDTSLRDALDLIAAGKI